MEIDKETLATLGFDGGRIEFNLQRRGEILSILFALGPVLGLALLCVEPLECN